MSTEQQLRIDDTGMRNMLRELTKRTGMSFRDVVRGVSRDVLTAAARNTNQAKPRQVSESVMKIFRKPFETPSGAKVGITRDNKVWFQGAGWHNKHWVLLNQAGKITAIKGSAFRTGSRQAKAKLSAKLKAEVNSALAQSRDWKKNELKYRRDQIGAGKATWLEILKQLGMTPANTRGLGRAMKVVLPSNHRSVVSGREVLGDRDRFAIQINSRSTSALNPRARGIGGFSKALNGQIKRFERAAQHDVVTYARQFADRNGFTVRG